MRSPLIALVVALVGLVGCSGDEPPASHVRSLALGNGYVAELDDEAGSLRVTRDGVLVLASAAGTPLFSARRDPDDPEAWHDPAAVDIPWARAEGAVQLTSPAPGALRLVLPEQPVDTALVSVALALDDGFYTGLGERFDHVDPRGTVAPMHLAIDAKMDSGTNEAHVPVPFLVSSKGYGVFVASREAGAFHIGAEHAPEHMRAAFEGRSLDVTLYFDPDPLEVVATYTRRTGLPRRPPLWALAPMHWRNEWSDSATVLADADAYRALGIPASCLWIDNPWQTAYNTATLDPARFGDTAALMASLAAKGFRPLAWSTPYLERPKGEPTNEAQVLYVKAAKAGHFIKDAGGGIFPALGCCHKGLGMLDFTSEPARAFWIDILGNATSAGFAGFKLDYGEDLVPHLIGARFSAVRSNGETERTGRTYPLGYHATYRAALDAARGDGFVIGRASTYGGQSQVDAIWPGDLANDFSTHTSTHVGGLPAAVVAAQTLSASGFPTFGSDTGGYRGGMPDREALLRWAEHTAFSVIMQLGGAGAHHNPWLMDDEAGAIYRDLAREHMRLVPYLANLAHAASTDGTPTIRALPLAYPDDLGARAVADTEYLLGPDLLVAPVTTAGVTKRLVHLPPGAWVGYWDKILHDGPMDLEVDTPIGKPPVFVRVGAILPLYPYGLDTLVEATEPAIVTLAMRAKQIEARLLVGGDATLRWGDDPSALVQVTDAPAALTLDVIPPTPVNDLFMELDLRRAALPKASARSLTEWDKAPLPIVEDEAAARACTESCWAQSKDGQTVWAHIMGPAALTILNAPL
jgi:alpha-D-xyloside xylohydrolase